MHRAHLYAVAPKLVPFPLRPLHFSMHLPGTFSGKYLQCFSIVAKSMNLAAGLL